MDWPAFLLVLGGILGSFIYLMWLFYCFHTEIEEYRRQELEEQVQSLTRYIEVLERLQGRPWNREPRLTEGQGRVRPDRLDGPSPRGPRPART